MFGRPLALLALALLGLAAALAPAVVRGFRLDASTESLVLEHDPDARRYDRTRLLFGNDEFVLVGVRRADLFSPEGVAYVASLHDRLAALEGVESVQSVVSVPLFSSFDAPVPPFQALAEPGFLRDALEEEGGIDLARARAELTDHALYTGNLVARDGETAGVLVNLVARPESTAAVERWLRAQEAVALARDAAQAASAGGDAAARRAADDALRQATAALEAERPRYVAAEDARKDERIRIVEAIRAVVAEARAGGVDAQASGVPAIVVEMVEAIERDLRDFSWLSVAFVLAFLAAVFRRIRWVVIPLLPVLASITITLAAMGHVGKRVTVITANVPSLLLVIGLAHALHMIVRWRELLARDPAQPSVERARAVARALLWPCTFTATTTAVGFASLVYAGSRPIIDFGLVMATGVTVALVVSFVVVPGLLSVLPPPGPDGGDGRLERSARLLEGLARGALRRPRAVVGAALGVAVAGAVGVSRLDVEARFIDYFRPGSPIQLGLTYIDQHLGGTSGLEVVLTGEPGAFGPANPALLDRAAAVEAWLRARPEVGVVMGYAGFLDEVREVLPGADRKRAAFFVGMAMSQGQLDPTVLDDYVVVEPREVEGRTVAPFACTRIVARVRETDPGLRRNALLGELRAFLAREFPADGPVRAEVTGMFVLYANMLASLVRSQVVTSLLAFGAIFLMLAALFRHPGAALLALVPNMLPIVVVLGAMGAFGVPLDMATVMIASISLGIGIDCAIHYLFRYREEVRAGEARGDVARALERSHGSIGTSILYTSLTSVVGFAVLAASEFRPNAYFGVFTGLAMAAALFAMLTVLPVLVAWTGLFRPADAGPPPAAPGGPEPPASPGAPPDAPPAGASGA